MTKTMLASAAVALPLALTASLMFVACQSGTEPLPDGPPREELRWRPAIGQSCGGLADTPCPGGLLCVDNPTDLCDMGTDPSCIGMCVQGGGRCLDADRQYITRNPNHCAFVTFLCAPEDVAFFDMCGCGCEPAPPGSTLCGETRCGPDEVCCDPVCDRCAPRGGSCVEVCQ
jgi:hypothetical protein